MSMFSFFIDKIRQFELISKLSINLEKRKKNRSVKFVTFLFVDTRHIRARQQKPKEILLLNINID